MDKYISVYNLSSEAEAIRIIRQLHGVAPLVALLRYMHNSYMYTYMYVFINMYIGIDINIDR